MATEVQRIRSRAKEIRDERASRTTKPYDASLDGDDADFVPDADHDVDIGATVRDPVETPADRIVRTEGLSAMRTVDDMAGLGDGSVAPPLRDSIRNLGRELGQQVDERVDELLEPIRDEIAQVIGTGPQKTPRGFVFGSLYGAGLAMAGMAAALILTRLGQRD